MPPCHVYVHVPFCARRCSYCDFAIAVRSRVPTDEFIGSLIRELALRAPVTPAVPVQTVYLGGGTPSRLGPEGVRRVLEIVQDRFPPAPDAEITIEANPDDVTAEAVAAWRAAGVNRVSLGVQSFDDRALAWMHRTHDAATAVGAAEAIREGGIENWSLDLIFSLPATLDRSWERDVATALELRPAHISLYGLTVESHTPISRWRDRGVAVEAPEESYEAEYLHAHSTLAGAGFEHYEVSNFARPGLRSRHNSGYWTGASYVGLGPGAHRFDGARRQWNEREYAAWVRRLCAGEDPTAGTEMLTAENRALEEVYLGLRTVSGLAVGDIEAEHLAPWVEAGWATIDDGRLRLTATGWLRLDALAPSLTMRRSR